MVLAKRRRFGAYTSKYYLFRSSPIRPGRLLFRTSIEHPEASSRKGCTRNISIQDVGHCQALCSFWSSRHSHVVAFVESTISSTSITSGQRIHILGINELPSNRSREILSYYCRKYHARTSNHRPHESGRLISQIEVGILDGAIELRSNHSLTTWTHYAHLHR